MDNLARQLYTSFQGVCEDLRSQVKEKSQNNEAIVEQNVALNEQIVKWVEAESNWNKEKEEKNEHINTLSSQVQQLQVDADEANKRVIYYQRILNDMRGQLGILENYMMKRLRFIPQPLKDLKRRYESLF